MHRQYKYIIDNITQRELNYILFVKLPGKFVKHADALGRRVQFLVALVAWAGKLSTLTMLMIPSIPW